MSSKFYDIMINDEKNTIFITLHEEKYKHIVAKVGHIEYAGNNDITFEMELPQGYEQYYDEEEYTNLIQNAVYDIVATSVKTFWNEAETKVLKDIEEKLQSLLKKYETSERDMTYLDAYAEKGYMVTENENGELIAIDINNQKEYNFTNEDDFIFLRKEIGCVSLIV